MMAFATFIIIIFLCIGALIVGGGLAAIFLYIFGKFSDMRYKNKLLKMSKEELKNGDDKNNQKEVKDERTEFDKSREFEKLRRLAAAEKRNGRGAGAREGPGGVSGGSSENERRSSVSEEPLLSANGNEPEAGSDLGSDEEGTELHKPATL